MGMAEFESGAKSSVIKPAYNLIPIEALSYIAERFALGASTHGPHNYKKGINDPVFWSDRENHAVEHLFNYINRKTVVGKDGRVDTPLDHLKAFLCNGSMFAWKEEELIRQGAGIVVVEKLPWEEKR